MLIPLKRKYRVYAPVKDGVAGKKNVECYGTSSDNQRKPGKLKRQKVTSQAVKDAIAASQPRVTLVVGQTGKRTFVRDTR